MNHLIGILLFGICLGINHATMATQFEQFNGEQIAKKYQKLQSFMSELEVENGGPIYETQVNIYKTHHRQCIIVAITDQDAGGGGNEDIIYFKHHQFNSGYSRIFNYELLNNATFSTKRDYQRYFYGAELKSNFKKYLKLMSKKTLAQC